MGVRGLTTYIAKHSDRYLEPYELKCCTIIVDGNNIACQLYNWVSKCNCAFGGDYDKYAKCVTEFFTLLLKCEVKPLVIFDGGYETKKIPTVRERLKKKLTTAKSVNPMTQSKLHIFPLFMKDVFMDVLRRLKISFAQSDFEADSEIAALARQLNCPVLSYDSDFYVYDVRYIPFSSVILEPVKYISSTDKSVKYYIFCKLYKIEVFLNSLGGLDKTLLPVLAVVLGNDYIEKQVLQNFLSQIKCPKYRSLNSTQQQIIGILKWLRNETMETAVTKILSHFKKHKRPSVSRKLKEIISGYKNTTSSLLSYLNTSDVTDDLFSNSFTYSNNINNNDDNTYQHCNIENGKKEIKGEEKIEETEAGKELEGEGEEVQEKEEIKGKEEKIEEKKLKEDENEQVREKEDLVDGGKEGSEDKEIQQNESDMLNLISDDINSSNENKLFMDLIPKWFIESFRQGDLPPNFINMIVLKTYFFTPQMEKFSLLFSHNISLPILRVIYGLLTSEFTEKTNLELNCLTYMRNAQIKNITLLPIYRTPSMNALPLLQDIPIFSINMRMSLIYDIAEFSSYDVQILNSFPSNWKIFILSLVYWARNVSEPIITRHHIHALLFSIIVLNVIDYHTGYCRSKKVFLKEYGSQLKKINESENISDLPSQQEFSNNDSVTEAITAVLNKDCLSVFDNVLPFHAMDESLKSRPKLFSLEVVHLFAQFQSCAYFINQLNALLNFPFPRCQIAHFYSGTLIYNAYTNFKKRSNVENYICKHLLNMSSLEMLYEVLVKTVACFLPDLFKTDGQKKNQRRKKKKPKDSDSLSENEQISDESESSEVAEFMKNNRFFALNLAS